MSFFKKIIPNFSKKKSVQSSDLEVQSSDLKDKSEDGLPAWLSQMLKEEEEENPERWVDESDYLIMSLGASMLFLSILLLSNKFNIPDPLFLGVAIFSIYFLVVTSMGKDNRFKLLAIAFTFPVTLNLSMLIIENEFDVSRINNSLSLAAIGFSLFYLPRQKIKDRSQLERNKLKTKAIRDSYDLIKKQDEIIALLENTITKLDNSLTEMQQIVIAEKERIDGLADILLDDKTEKKEKEDETDD